MRRRQFLEGLAVFAFLDFADGARANAPEADEVLALFDERARRMMRGELDVEAWHKGLDELRFDAASIARWIDLEKLKATFPLPSNRFGSRKIRLKRSERLGRVGFDTFLFGFRAGTAVPPHGHENVAALLCVVDGELRARHWDRLEDREGGTLLRPSIDRVLGPGQASWVSDAKDNVHWLQAEKPVYALDLAVPEVRRTPGAPRAKEQRLRFFDMNVSKPAGDDGELLAPTLSMAAALKTYGRL